jgi:hypothetical protein
VNRHHVLRSVVFSVVVAGAAIVGPRLGEAISPSDGLGWQLLPWGLIALCWVGLIAWMRRARRAP